MRRPIRILERSIPARAVLRKPSTAYRQVIRLQPNSPQGYHNLGVALAATGTLRRGHGPVSGSTTPGPALSSSPQRSWNTLRRTWATRSGYRAPFVGPSTSIRIQSRRATTWHWRMGCGESGRPCNRNCRRRCVVILDIVTPTSIWALAISRKGRSREQSAQLRTLTEMRST